MDIAERGASWYNGSLGRGIGGKRAVNRYGGKVAASGKFYRRKGRATANGKQDRG